MLLLSYFLLLFKVATFIFTFTFILIIINFDDFINESLSDASDRFSPSPLLL